MGSRSAALLLVLLLAPLASREVRARPVPRDRPAATPARERTADDEKRKVAREHYRKGKTLFFRKRYAEAIDEFLKAYRYWDHPVLLYNLASAYALQDEPLQARVFLRLYLLKERTELRKLPPYLRKVQAETAMIIVRVGDPEADIYVDGRLAGRARAEIAVKPGTRTLEIRKGAWVARQETIEMAPGGERELEIDKLPPPPPPPRPDPPPRPEKRKGLGRLPWAYLAGTGGGTVLLAAVAVGLSVVNQSTYRDFEKRPWDAALADKGKRLQSAANAVWGLTAAGAVATAVVAVFTRWRRTGTERTRIVPVLYPGGAALTLEF